MLTSTILETAIGLILVFLSVSLLCSALREVIEALLKQRAVDLERGMRALLQDKKGDGLARELYSHPLVFSLFEGEYKPITRVTEQLTGLKKFAAAARNFFQPGGRLPSYIPSESFARALIDLEQQGRIDNPAISGVLRSLAQDTAGDIARLRSNVEAWFNASTERVGGWYKRRTMFVLFVLGFGTAAALNINPFVIAQKLYHEADLRKVVVASAEAVVAAGDTASSDSTSSRARIRENLNQLQTLAAAGLPMGWKDGPPPNEEGARAALAKWWFLAALGWLATALAVTLGAPFWFDLLNKFMALRSSIKPKQASESQGEQRQRTAPADAEGVSSAAHVAPDGTVIRVNRAAIPLPLVTASAEANAWKDGKEDGLL